VDSGSVGGGGVGCYVCLDDDERTGTGGYDECEDERGVVGGVIMLWVLVILLDFSVLGDNSQYV
jgi:hypothetical protein